MSMNSTAATPTGTETFNLLSRNAGKHFDTMTPSNASSTNLIFSSNGKPPLLMSKKHLEHKPPMPTTLTGHLKKSLNAKAK
jgi:hypothetical protein